ncbi:MAG: DUF5103 domain-containing protein [Duncaniella sp.]|nr:DUF5103 domain-containing protein [Duncaniella sp.]
MVTMTRAISLLLLFASAAATLHAQTEDTRQGVMNPSFKSLQVTVDGDIMSLPVITLGPAMHRLSITFDELAEERRWMRYSLEHCDAAWRPEGLAPSEFLDSFNEGTVEEYEYSQATTVHYVHYRITIPNDELRITQPGNYLLRVYDEQDPEETLLQARFSIVDPQVSVGLEATSRTDIDTNEAHQQLGIRVGFGKMDVADPFSDIKVTITQNGRPDTERILTTPTRLGAKEIFYEHIRPLIFEAGNEYRRFETVSTRYPGMHIDWIDIDAPVCNAGLAPDRPRTSYAYDQTQNGRYKIRTTDLDDSDRMADYVLTHFTLMAPRRTDGNYYIEGDLTDRRADVRSRMTYDQERGAYTASLLLKQGSYNYQYIFVPDGSSEGLAGPAEGNHYQTANEYTVKVYHRPKGTRFDRLVGVSTITSGI